MTISQISMASYTKIGWSGYKTKENKQHHNYIKGQFDLCITSMKKFMSAMSAEFKHETQTSCYRLWYRCIFYWLSLILSTFHTICFLICSLPPILPKNMVVMTVVYRHLGMVDSSGPIPKFQNSEILEFRDHRKIRS